MEKVIIEFLQWVTPIVFGVFTYIINKKIDRNIKKSERRAELRRKETLFQTELLLSNTNLTKTIGDCLKKGKFNGELKKAVKVCEEAENNYRTFLKQTAIEKIQE